MTVLSAAGGATAPGLLGLMAPAAFFFETTLSAGGRKRSLYLRTGAGPGIFEIDDGKEARNRFKWRFAPGLRKSAEDSGTLQTIRLRTANCRRRVREADDNRYFHD